MIKRRIFGHVFPTLWIFGVLMVLTGFGKAQLPQGRGVWLSRDVIRNGRAHIEEAVYRLKQANFNRIFVNVQHLGGTIYPSKVVESAGGPRQLPGYEGRDPLQEVIEIAHFWGLEVVAWFEYGLMAYWSGVDTTDGGPILTAHPQWEAITRDGTHYQQNENGVFHWMDPAHPEVVDFLTSLFEEVALNYPDLDAVETDRIRYPSQDFSYSEIARQRYQQETGGTDPKEIDINHSEWPQWVAWREQQITHLAGRIYSALKEANPALLVSAAVGPPYMLLANEKLQAWDVWVDSGYVDALEPMLYLDDYSFEYQLGLAQNLVPEDFLLYPGIAYQGDVSLHNQLSTAIGRGTGGATIWYYGYLTDATMEMLKNGLFEKPAELPHNVRLVDDGSPVGFRVEGDWQQENGGFLGTYQVAKAGAGAVATWQTSILKSGQYAAYARWVADSANSNSACYRIILPDSTLQVYQNQQLNGVRWNLLMVDSLSFGTRVTIQLNSDPDGRVIADAVRLVWQPPFDIVDLYTPDSLHLTLKVNRLLEKASAENPDSYQIQSGISVIEARLDSLDASVVYLQTSPMMENQSYDLRLDGLRDSHGVVLPTVQKEFRYPGNISERVIDNSDPTFALKGEWTTVISDDGVVGGSYLLAQPGSGGTWAQWWYTMPEDGYYDIAVWVPADPDNRLANDVPYRVLHNFGVDTLRRAQRGSAGEWLSLGTYYYGAGKVASVQVSNGVDEGLVAADAMMIRRVVQITDIHPSPVLSIPVAPLLKQNYPNPFNPRTTIEFQLPVASRVTLRIFNTLGQEVAVLLEKTLPPGTYRIPFEAGDLSSGIYFYQLLSEPQTGGQAPSQITKRMLLLR